MSNVLQFPPLKPENIELFNVVVALPAGDEVKSVFAMNLASMAMHTVANAANVIVRPIMVRSTLLPSGRQKIVQQALAEKATHVLWLDTDMKFPKDVLFQLLKHDKDIVVANYAQRKFPYAPVSLRGPDGAREHVYTRPESTGLEPVSFTGLGCALVKAAVFEKLPLPWFQLLYRKETADFGGEDAFFCFHAAAHGYEIFVDHDLSKQVAHIGEMEITMGHSLAMLEAKQQALTEK